MKESKDFTSLFIRREGSVILGYKYVNIITIFIILLLTFFSIGFSNGSEKYLDKKMNDPYNYWICFDKDIAIRAPELKTLIYKLNSDSIIKKYFIKAIAEHPYEIYDFYPKKLSDNNKRMRGLGMDSGMSLLKTILSKESIIKCNSLEELRSDFNNSHGIVVAKKMLEKLDSTKKSQYPEFLSYGRPDNDFENDILFSIPILAVVETLPLNVDFIGNENSLFFLRERGFIRGNETTNDRDPIIMDSIIIYLNADISIESINYLKKFIASPLPKNLFKESSFNKGKYYSIKKNTINDSIKTIILKEFSDSIYSDNDTLHIVQTKNVTVDRRSDYEPDLTTNFITIQLHKLDKVLDFKKYLEDFPKKNNFEKKLEEDLISINISGIKNKENLNFISHLTKLLSYALLFFSIFSLLLFLNNIIISHFEKIKKNLGTLKAFGLSNKILIRNYIIIFMGIIFIASTLAFITALILGELGLATYIFEALDIPIDKGYNCFSLLSSFGVFSFLIILFVCLIIILIKLRRLLMITPGDLVFER